MLVIKNWNTHFETAQSRKVSNLTWVAIPNNLNSRGYRKIMKHPDRAKVFAAWIILIEIASNSRTRGHLGDEDGPYTTEDLELYSDFPKEDFELAIPFLKEIGWVCEQGGSELVADSEHASSGLVDTVQDSTVQNNNIYINENGFAPIHGTELFTSRRDMEVAWNKIPKNRQTKKRKFSKAWVEFVERSGVDKGRIGELLESYYETEEGRGKYHRSPFRLLEDEFWSEDCGTWGKDRGDKKFPESSFDHTKIIKSYLASNPEQTENIKKRLSEGGKESSLAFQIWKKYPEHRI
tara:strand:- start:3308 stop:4186 length:879 start_codon:yes stop_codon:yes gene_type:complete